MTFFYRFTDGVNGFRKRATIDNGYTLFLYLLLVSMVVFLTSLIYFREDFFNENSVEVVYSLITTFLNPFYIFLILFPVFYLIYRLLPGAGFKAFLFAVSGVFFTYLVIEKMVYDQFRFHINSFVLKILQQKGALQVLGIGTLEITAIITSVILFAVFSWAGYFVLGKSSLPSHLGEKLKGGGRKLLLVLLVLLVFLIDKTIFAWYLYNKKPSVYVITNQIPLYMPSQGGKFFRKMGFEPAVAKQPSLDFSLKQIKYPLEPYQTGIKPGQKLPNIIILLSDALRPDMITPEIMPNLHRFKQQHVISYDNHYSGSNGTSQGLFTLFFGLPSRYMSFFSKAEVSPVFFDALLQNDYQLELLSSKSLGWLGTDEVVFFKVRDYIRDELDHSSVKSDKMITDLALEELEAHQPEQDGPLFLFVFYDSTHLPHFYDQRFEKFKPHKTSVLFNPKKKEDRVRGLNQYKNAANYVDSQMGRIVEKLEKEGYLENSVIYISSDHGSEKYEKGYWGHASAFTNEQLQVPSLLYYPGATPQNVTRLTSHADVGVTLMELMGETYNKEHHSLGQSLMDDSTRDYIIADGLANRVLIDDHYKIDYTPFEGISYYKVTDADDNPVENPDEIIAAYTPKILKMFDDLQRFLR